MRLTDKQRLEVEYNMGKFDGIKEVVEWVNYYLELPELSGSICLEIIKPQWQAKLEEWGLDNG